MHNPERKIAVLTRLAELSAVLNSTLQIDTLLGHLMDAAAEVTDSEAASVLLWNGRTQQLFFAATTTSGASSALIGKPVPLEGSIAGTIMRERRVVQVDDALNDPRIYTKPGEEIQFVTRSLLGVPMTSKDKLIGVLEVINGTRQWDEEDARSLSVLAAQAAVAIEQAQMMMALQKANDELKELDKLKNDFIAIASHELRTPLGVIMGYASFLQETGDQEVNEHATKVLSSAIQLRSIIEGLTNLRYLKQKESELNRENVALADVMRDSLQEAVSLGMSQGDLIDVRVPSDDVRVHVDAARVSMALNNVLNNAIKFTPERGHITVHTEVHNGEAHVLVTDDGIGIAPEHLGRIFEEFYQVEDHMIRRFGGLGIGLSIAKALIEAHGGRIWASSDGLGKGSTVTLTLPLAK
jgi:signal transduction histidine kinase